MKAIGLRPIPDSTMTATIPSTATSMTAGMSSRRNGCLFFGSAGGGWDCTGIPLGSPSTAHPLGDGSLRPL